MVGRRSAVQDLSLAVLLIAQLAWNNDVQADILCYACSSYMSQCQPDLLVRDVRNVFKARCSGKCFIRQGEDNATYRGCFDGFSSVVDLTDGYIGCRSQTWNNKRRQWCLCNTDLCNVDLQPPSSSSQHQRRHPPPPTVAHGNAAPLPPLPLPSKHPVRPSQGDPRNDFFESFADKAKYRRQGSGATGGSPAPTESLVFPVDYAQQRRQDLEGGIGRNQTNYNNGEEIRRGPNDHHFKEQDDHDVLFDEPIDSNQVQVKGRDDVTSQRSLPLPSLQTKEQNSKENGPSKESISQITYNADKMSFESLDYPYNQYVQRSLSVNPSQVSHLDDRDHHHQRKVDSVQADGPDRSRLQNNDSTTRKGVNEITERTNEGKELKSDARDDLDKIQKDEELDSRAFVEEHIADGDLPEDYPYNQIFNEGLAKEDLELLTKPRPFELRFSQTLSPSGESGGKPKPSKSTLEALNDISNQQKQESTRAKERAVGGANESPLENELIKPGSLNEKQPDRQQPNHHRNEISGFDARERLAIHDADILWIGQDRAPTYDDDIGIPQESENKKRNLERDSTDLEHQSGIPFRHHIEQGEKKSDGEVEGTRTGETADIKDAQVLRLDDQEAKTLEKTEIDGRAGGVQGERSEEEEFTSRTNQVEQSTLKAATTIRCFRTGYYDNPTDCTQFIACLLDPRSRAYILHFMRCPAGLSWDNTRKLCMETSSTCYSSRNHSYDDANRIDSPVDGIELTQKHLLLDNSDVSQ